MNFLQEEDNLRKKKSSFFIQWKNLNIATGAKFIKKFKQMNDFLARYGQWALVAGSAEGLGDAFSRALARRKINLVMIDHKEDILSKLAADLEKSYGIKTMPLPLDLGDKNAAKRIMEAIRDLDCRLLVYVAAFSKVQPFMRNNGEDLENYININTRTPLLLASEFAGKCREYGSGGMLFMSSLAGLWGTQLLGPYGATKAFTHILAEALHHELKPYGVDVMACIAGATATPAYLATNPRYGWIKPKVMKPEELAEKALSRFGKGATCIPGFSNRVNYFMLSRVLSRGMASKLFNATTARMYREKF
jgi:short-subunit dehydrogenase